MLSVKNICTWLFIAILATIIPAVIYLKWADEIILILLIALAVIDCIAHGNWRKHALLWMVIGILSAYAFYSILFLHYNTTPYILYDLLLESKPFVPFYVCYAIAPEFTSRQSKIIEYITLANCTIATIILIGGEKLIDATVSHPAFCGVAIMTSILAYMMVKINNEGEISKQARSIITIFLLCGILCGRSKYYGETVLALFFLYIYRPGMFSKFTFKHAAIVVAVAISVIFVGWSKFSYYFLTGNNDTFDPETIETFARPVLYVTGMMILVDHIPFGSGLASFASYPSAANYSNLYYEYGINKVYGLSPELPAFICDAYYPVLAQFGFVGVILFFSFFRWIYKRLIMLIHSDALKYKYYFCIGSTLIVFALIESIGGTALSQNSGMCAMMLLGLICGRAKNSTTTTQPQPK